jgi:hypothetical protein
MGHSAHMQRFDNADSFGQQCMETQEILSKDVDHVQGTPISTIFRSNSLMSGELTTWDHSRHQRNASTFWWQ